MQLPTFYEWLSVNLSDEMMNSKDSLSSEEASDRDCHGKNAGGRMKIYEFYTVSHRTKSILS